MHSNSYIRYTAWTALAVIFTWLLHEFAHWGTGTAMGYDLKMTLNTVGLVSGEYSADWQSLLVTAAGPVVTMLQAFVVYAFLSRTNAGTLYPLLFVPFYMRLAAGVINLISLNDEGVLSQALGLGTFTVPAVVSTILFVLVFRASRREGIPARTQVLTVATVMVVSSALILGDQAFDIRLL